jgi:hypothetical protein
MPPFTLQFFDSNLWTIPANAYLEEDVDSEGGHVCILLIQGKADLKNFKYIIGSVFLDQVYSIFDNEKNQVGFFLNKESEINLGQGETPPPITVSSLPAWALVLIVIAVAAFIVAVIIGILCFIKIRRRKAD